MADMGCIATLTAAAASKNAKAHEKAVKRGKELDALPAGKVWTTLEAVNNLFKFLLYIVMLAGLVWLLLWFIGSL